MIVQELSSLGRGLRSPNALVYFAFKIHILFHATNQDFTAPYSKHFNHEKTIFQFDGLLYILYLSDYLLFM